MNSNEISALIKLLDDPDVEVYSHIESKLLSLGKNVIPYLESEWETSFDAIVQQRLEQIISIIQFDSVKEELMLWADSSKPDLFDGVFLLAKYKYPDLDKDQVNEQLDKIRLDVWLELNSALTAFEKVKVLNHVFYNLYQFAPNVSNYHAPQNSFINNVLESRKGNPVSLSVIYQIIANRLEIPIYGVNLPQHFVLAYKDSKLLDSLIFEALNKDVDAQTEDGVIFYINAFNRGALLSMSNIEQFLKQLNLPNDPKYLKPCSNIDIVKRMLRNLAYSYKQQSETVRLSQVAQLLNILGEEIDLSDSSSKEEDDDSESDE
ncbi:MAG: hypothetical protein HYZ42_05655 [Bacteroidetes bacterium]|nr:hypothetical protein [Bacteroidota bacterium]